MTAESGVEPGRVVRSRAGRDRGRYYLVMAVQDERYVWVADGATRTVRRPKKKNVRHLEVERRTLPEIVARFQAGRAVRDEDVREALRQIVPAQEAAPEGRGNAAR